jgi:hypothetical protein
VVARHRVSLAAFLAQPHPKAPVLCEHVFDRHPERRADAGEGIDHEPDQGAIAQPGVRRDIDAVEQRARFRRIEHRRLPARYDVPAKMIWPDSGHVIICHARLSF